MCVRELLVSHADWYASVKPEFDVMLISLIENLKHMVVSHFDDFTHEISSFIIDRHSGRIKER